MIEKHRNIITIIFVSLILTLALILSSFFVYRNYRKEKIIETGKFLCTQLMNASITYYRENSIYLENDRVAFNYDYPFDARTNSYFSIFSTYSVGKNKQVISFFGSDEMEKYELRAVFDKNSEIKNIRNINIQVLKNKTKGY